MKNRFRRVEGVLRVGLLAIAISVALSGCSTRPERTIKVSNDWSRGQRLGYATLQQFSALEVEPDGATVHVAWSGREEAGQSTEIYYAQLDGLGNVVKRQVLPYLFLPRRPILASNARGGVHLLSFARRDGSSPDGVFYMLLNQEGVPQGDGMQVSAPDDSVTGFDAVAYRDGQLEVFWSTDVGGSSALYHQRLGADGRALTDPMLISDGFEPAACIDGEGNVHLAWFHKTRTSNLQARYAEFKNRSVSTTDGTAVGDAPAEGVGVRRPIRLGIDARQVYLTWSIEWRSGLSAGTAIAPLIHFPIGRPGDARIENIAVPHNATDYDISLGITVPSDTYRLEQLRLAPPGGPGRISPFLEAPNVATGQGSEVAIIVGSQVAYRQTDDTQMVLSLYESGQLVGYELAARSTSPSSWPVLDTDDQGHLYMVWVDYDTPTAHGVYFSSTRPEMQANLDQRTRQDYLLGAASTGWGIVSGLSLVPLVLVLMVPVVLWCGAWYIIGIDDALSDARPLVGFGIALVIYYLSKLMVLSPVLMTPPGLSIIPGSLRSVWSIALIAIVGAVSALVLWRAYWRKADRPALFPAALWFTAVDGLLTLLLYGIPFFGD